MPRLQPVESGEVATPPPVAIEIARQRRTELSSIPAEEARLALSLAAAACLIHFAANGRYGYFRDELYYAACGQHLAWGYVDQAPLIALVARFSRWLGGNSLFALRFFPALSAGAKILLTAWMVHELGGRRMAQWLAGLGILLAPIYLTFDNFLSMNAFEPVFWTLCAVILTRIIRLGNQRLWLRFGWVAGLGLLNKQSMLFFGSGIILGLLLTPERRFFRKPWIWLGAAISLGIFLPNLLWEAQHGWPTLEILSIVNSGKNTVVSPLTFLLEQSFLILPLAVPICLAGLYFFFCTKQGEPYRVLGWAYLTVLSEMLLLHGKIYYLAPAYPMLFAAGAVWWEGVASRRRWNWLKPALVAPLAVGGLIAAPLALPVLPGAQMARYSDFWDVKAVRVENAPVGKLPQLFADMFGWENQAQVIARVYRRLSPEERRKCALLAGNYGEAGAIDYFGPALNLPRAISPHNNYYLWGPREYTGELVIAWGMPKGELETIFRKCRAGGHDQRPVRGSGGRSPARFSVPKTEDAAPAGLAKAEVVSLNRNGRPDEGRRISNHDPLRDLVGFRAAQAFPFFRTGKRIGSTSAWSIIYPTLLEAPRSAPGFISKLIFTRPPATAASHRVPV